MRRLTFLILLFVSIIPAVNAQSPHGKKLKYDCSDCHQSDNWKVLLKKPKFDHSQTEFALLNQHKTVNCTSCHKSLVFSEIKDKQNCFSCHKDVHQNTVGSNCISCHSTKSWLLTNIAQIHDENRFPLLGVHQNADCIQCHKQFDKLKLNKGLN